MIFLLKIAFLIFLAMKYLKITHLIIGIMVFLLFLYTGQLMRHQYFVGEMEGMSRALYRANHLYILLFGLINISLGNYLNVGDWQIKKITQTIGSFLILIATVLVIYSFFVDLPTEGIERPHARNALYLILAGVLFHTIPDRKS